MSLRPAAPANGSPRCGSVMPGAWPTIRARWPSRAHRIGGGVIRGHIRQPAIVRCNSASVRTRAAGWGGIRAYATRPVSTPERISADLVICRLAQLATPGGETGQPLRGAALGDVEVHNGDMWIAAYAGEIVAVGHGYEIRDRLDLDDDATIIDAPGLVAVPGLIDCHTHACFAGDRLEEFDQRSRGATYEEIHASGGGILSTVRATREASQPELVENTRRHLAGMLEHGTTTVEVKSGYGLDPEVEHSMLRAIQEAGYESAAHVISTCLAAHAVPPEAESADAYITTCIDEILPDVAEWGLAEAVDVFVERGAFDVAQARRYLEDAREHGLALRLHGDQFTEVGALDLAIELEARSDRPSRSDGSRGRREARGLRCHRRRAADSRAHARAPDARGARPRRRGWAARARNRLQSRLEPVRLAAGRHAPRLHANAACPRRRRSRPSR